MAKGRISHWTQITVLGLLLLALAVYFPPYHFAWVGDDYVQLNYVAGYLQRPLAAIAFFHPYELSWYYRPLQNISFLINRLWFGLTPFGHYATLLNWHLLAICLVYRVGRQLRLAPWAALVSAGLFAVHGHFLDVAAWLSSVAILQTAVFSLLTLSTYLTYLRHHHSRHLAMTFLLWLVALLSHEEGLLLVPVFAWLYWRLEIRDWRLNELVSNLQSPISSFLFFTGLLAIAAAYVAVQLHRPNLTIDLGQTSAEQWLAYLSPLELSRFAATTLDRLFMLPPSATPLLNQTLLITALCLLITSYWLWQGGHVVRLGMLWAGLHLGFIYWALWTQKPELYAGRHIYNAWIGFTLALSAGIDWFLRRERLEIRDWRLKELVSNLQSPISSLTTVKNRQTLAAVLVAITISTAYLAYHIRLTRLTQELWLEKAREDKAVEAQMKTLLPPEQVTADTHLFVNRFVITPRFFHAVARVWYERQLSPPLGSLSALRDYGRAADGFYLFDYTKGTLRNLMPELQQHEETVFLWSRDPRVEITGGETADFTTTPYNKLRVAGPENDQRLALNTTIPSGVTRLTLVYPMSIPDQSQFHVGLRQSPVQSLAYRVCVLGNDNMVSLHEVTLPAGEDAWHEAQIDVSDYWGRTVILYLTVERTETAVADNAHWANPRFVSMDPLP